MKLRKVVILVTVFALACNTLAGCGNKEVNTVPGQVTENGNETAMEEENEETKKAPELTEDSKENVSDEEGSDVTDSAEVTDEKINESDTTETNQDHDRTEQEETWESKENDSDKENKKPAKDDNKKTDRNDNKKPAKDDDKKPNKGDSSKPGKTDDKKPQKGDSKPSESENGNSSQDGEKNAKISPILAAEFAAGAAGAASAQALAESIAANKQLDVYGLVATPVQEGYLSGFNNDINGFDEGAVFSPVIGTIPFVGYVFKTSDTDALVKTLKENANLRWNICTSAEVITVKTSGDYVLFAMTPESI